MSRGERRRGRRRQAGGLTHWALLLICIIARGAVVGQEWSGGKLSLALDDGAAEIEWISPVAFRVARSWGGPVGARTRIAHPEVAARFEDSRMITRYLTVEADGENIRVRNGVNPIATVTLARAARGVTARFSPMERVYGLGGGGRGSLNLHGEKLARGSGFFFTSNGYGAFLRAPALCAFDFGSGVVEAQGVSEIEFVFYYGPTPKEILEQHTAVVGRAGGAPVSRVVDGFAGLEDLVRGLNEASLSAELDPVVNVAVAGRAPEEVRRRAADLAALVPGMRGVDGGDRSLQVALGPYFAAYRQETAERGYPLVRPLVMEFPRDAGAELRSDLLMLGDDLLVAPVLGEGESRRVDLPRGSWTDLRTGVEYQGRRVVDVEAPVGEVPVFARNGGLIPMLPMNGNGGMELHYFPPSGGEFFLSEGQGNSQFHAAPAGDLLRLEMESRVARTYEWVVHRAGVTKVFEESGVYVQEGEREKLRDGSWWVDSRRGEVHVVVKVAAGEDRVVMVGNGG